MSVKSTKTIDDLGIQSYLHYEENRKYFDEEFASNSRAIASQLSTDVFEPIIVTDYQILFELGTKGSTWSLMPPPLNYNDQKGRLFTFQLAPKLGPVELLELQMSRIESKRKEEKSKSVLEKNGDKNPDSEGSEEGKHIDKEANTLIEMMQNILSLNKIMAQIISERYRYSKG
ncbi:MAG: hypothetical protein FJZ59_05295 [Chlamydiae bacterium]|nr:hypothetical protein [Chlamydiota bacterium]